MPLKQTLHINEKVLFYWLKTKEEGLLQMKSVFQGCLNPCFGLNLQPAFSAKLFWWFESEISVVWLPLNHLDSLQTFITSNM